MSFHLGRNVLDGLVNTFKNIPVAALGVQGVPSDTTFLSGTGWKQPTLVAPVAPTPDGSAMASSGVRASGSSWSWQSGGGTSGSYGIVLLNCVNGAMDLGLVASVTWGSVTMTRLGGVYNNNNPIKGFSLVFVLDGIPAGNQTITATVTQTGKTFTGFGSSYSYTNVASVGSLRTFYGLAASPSFTVSAVHTNDIMWGAICTNGTVLSGFSLTNPRQHSTSFSVFNAGDETGALSYTIGGTSTGTEWGGVALDLIAAVALSTDQVSEGSTNLYYTDARADARVAVGNAATATKLATARNIDGQAFDGSAAITVVAPATHAATSKTTPVDADELPIADSAGSFGLKKLTWANLKAMLDLRYVSQQTSTFVEYIGTTSVTGVAVPAGVLGLEITQLTSPGSGGGSGCLSTSGTIAGGGGAGGGGATVRNRFIPASALGSTYAYSCPAAGAGGAAQATANTAGNPGVGPGYATFTSGPTMIEARGASAGGSGGTNAAGGAAGSVTNSVGTIVGTTGGAGSSTTTAGTGGTVSLLGGSAGGGGGGGVTATPAASNGGAGGINLAEVSTTAAAGGVVGGASPSTGAAAVSGQTGAGAGGGAGAISGAAQAGANATGYGGGGGGGGGALGSGPSGAGGSGGPGYFGFRWIYS